MTPEVIARQYLMQGMVMQIATLREGLPRVNSVYYVAADDMSAVYWMSEPTRRHSVSLLQDGNMAGAIVHKATQPVAGLQFTGTGSVVSDSDELRGVIDKYNEKHQGAAKGLYERIKAKTNGHIVYKMTLTSLELFDEQNFPKDDVISISVN